jgi:hypothetical protein
MSAHDNLSDDNLSEEQGNRRSSEFVGDAWDDSEVGTQLAGRIDHVIALLQQAEIKTRELLRIARGQRLSFGLTYNYVDEDIAQALGRLRYMRLIAEHRQDPRQKVRY